MRESEVSEFLTLFYLKTEIEFYNRRDPLLFGYLAFTHLPNSNNPGVLRGLFLVLSYLLTLPASKLQGMWLKFSLCFLCITPCHYYQAVWDLNIFHPEVKLDHISMRILELEKIWTLYHRIWVLKILLLNETPLVSSERGRASFSLSY